MDEDLKKAFFDEMQERFNDLAKDKDGKNKKSSWYITYSIIVAGAAICLSLIYVGAKIESGRQIFITLSNIPNIVSNNKRIEDSTHIQMMSNFYASIKELRNEFILSNRFQNQNQKNQERAYKNDTIQVRQP